jgi:YebC/PmpR family DNA-binding regulatory protein
MSGHSQFKNIMYRKGAQDAKRAKIFAKIAREITVAANTGGNDSSANPRLRAALALAREHNMPKDNVERAIAKASGPDDGSNFNEVRYEGYGPGGTAFIVESLTDNRNRTASEVRSAFSKFGGNLGETGSVAFAFSKVGHLVYKNISGAFNKIFDFAVEIGADNVTEFDDVIEIISSVDSFACVRDAFCKEFGDPIDSGIIWQPNDLIQCSDDTKVTLRKLIDALEDNDDVQKVFHNIDEE